MCKDVRLPNQRERDLENGNVECSSGHLVQGKAVRYCPVFATRNQVNELNKMHKVNKKYLAEAIESREKYVRVKYSSGEASIKHNT